MILKNLIKQGLTYRQLLDSYELNASQLRILDNYYSYLSSEERVKPIVYYYGPTCTGKILAASTFKDIYWKDGTKWWDGYDNHETIVIDDFRVSHMKFNILLRLLDTYPFRCEYKSGSRYINSKYIIITSNRHFKDLYNLPDEDIDQLKRRIDVIINYDSVTDVQGNTVPERLLI
jgi:hypothetical protein